MSDDPIPAPAEKPKAPAGLYRHWCQQPGCTEWGSFGFARTRDQTDWYCREHRPEDK
jgi:hypothetical protein